MTLKLKDVKPPRPKASNFNHQDGAITAEFHAAYVVPSEAAKAFIELGWRKSYFALIFL